MPQPYVREEALAAQPRRAVQTASLPDAWAEKKLEKIQEWRRTTAQASAAAAQPFKEKLAALERRLERLLDAHLDGVVSREEYTRRKEKALIEKSSTSARRAEVERQGNHWLEPLERFVRAVHQAHSVARTLPVSYENPWRLVAARGRNENWWS